MSAKNVAKRRKNRREELIRKNAEANGGVPHCTYCGVRVSRRGVTPHEPPSSPVQFLTRDHIIPRALGGCDDRRNQCVVCRPCNEKRATTPLDIFIESLGVQAVISVEQAREMMAEAQAVCDAIRGGRYDTGWRIRQEDSGCS